ncbi:MAG: FHA domain-containing protein [Lachnospiraceae bacterium]|nr:FHA domain-containing protein [Lachnospiraceae bacterium]
MRTFNFMARNIGQERYLTYTMGEECELDEDVLDYCEENKLKELVEIIYEEDEDYDYLTYDITGKVSVEDFTAQEVNCEKVLFILRNVAANLISLKEQAVHLSYIIMNKKFMYIDPETLDIQFICLPVESKASVVAEFKGFMRQLLANMKYDVDEDLNYVGKLLTYINGDNFNLRGLIGLSEALMEEEGLSFESAGDIEADGVEVVSAEEPQMSSEENISDFMSSLPEEDEPLPEIGDDEEEEEVSEAASPAVEEELESILPAGMKEQAEETVEKVVEETVEEVVEEIPAPKTNPIPVVELPEDKPLQKETDVDVIKNRIKQLVNEVPSARPKQEEPQNIKTIEELDQFLDKPPVVKKNVIKVNRAALIQSAAAEHEETEELKTEEPVVESVVPVETTSEDAESKPKSNSILSKTVPDTVAKKSTLLNAPKAMPYLIRVNTEERIMLGKVVFKIGKASRGVDYSVSGNGAISRQHAVITQKDGVCYIKDNKSTNHTYVNGKIVEDGVEEILTHDSMIRLGDEEFLFKIR